MPGEVQSRPEASGQGAPGSCDAEAAALPGALADAAGATPSAIDVETAAARSSCVMVRNILSPQNSLLPLGFDQRLLGHGSEASS